MVGGEFKDSNTQSTKNKAYNVNKVGQCDFCYT